MPGDLRAGKSWVPARCARCHFSFAVTFTNWLCCSAELHLLEGTDPECGVVPVHAAWQIQPCPSSGVLSGGFYRYMNSEWGSAVKKETTTTANTEKNMTWNFMPLTASQKINERLFPTARDILIWVLSAAVMFYMRACAECFWRKKNLSGFFFFFLNLLCSCTISSFIPESVVHVYKCANAVTSLEVSITIGVVRVFFSENEHI